jgi:hypothetical protein
VENSQRTFLSPLGNAFPLYIIKLYIIIFPLLNPSSHNSDVPAKVVTQQAVKWKNTNNLSLKIWKEATTDYVKVVSVRQPIETTENNEMSQAG